MCKVVTKQLNYLSLKSNFEYPKVRVESHNNHKHFNEIIHYLY